MKRLVFWSELRPDFPGGAQWRLHSIADYIGGTTLAESEKVPCVDFFSGYPSSASSSAEPEACGTGHRCYSTGSLTDCDVAVREKGGRRFLSILRYCAVLNRIYWKRGHHNDNVVMSMFPLWHLLLFPFRTTNVVIDVVEYRENIIWYFIFNILRFRGYNFIFVSESVRAFYKKIGITGKVVYTPAFVNLVDRKTTGLYSQRFDNPSSGYFLVLARLYSHKNVGKIVREFNRYVTLGGARNLLIAGTGPEMSSLIEDVSALNLGERVEFIGFFEEIEKGNLISESSAIIQASQREGFPNILIEACSLSVPSITVDFSGNGSISEIRERNLGLVCDQSDGELAAAMIRFDGLPSNYFDTALAEFKLSVEQSIRGIFR